VAMQALRINPTHSISLCSLGYLALHGALSDDPKQQLNEAEKLYRAALMADPASSVAAAACAEIVMKSRSADPAPARVRRRSPCTHQIYHSCISIRERILVTEFSQVILLFGEMAELGGAAEDMR
jgi:hypothetical protein